MDSEKTRKVGLEAFIGDEAKQAGEAIAKATKGYDKMMRGYEKAMKAATGISHLDAAYRAACGPFNDAAYRAAFGSMHDAAYSEARRVAEMTRAFGEHIAGISDITRQFYDAAIALPRLIEMDYVEQLRRDMSVAFNPSLTQDFASAVQSAMDNAYILSHGLDASIVKNIDGLQETVNAALASLPDYMERPITLLPPAPPPRLNPATQFMARLEQQYNEAIEQAEEEGGIVIVTSTSATGDQIRVAKVSSLDEHFVLVEGVDLNNQPRSFKANCGGVNLAIEVVQIEEDPESDSDDEDFVN